MIRARWTRLVLASTAAALLLCGTAVRAEDQWVVYPGGQGPGAGKHVVLVAGDDEYRSEEMLPALGKILSQHHGFKCTVLFPIDPATGEIKPDHQTNIPGLEALRTADLAVLFLRFRNLPDEQMKELVDYIESGRPIVGIRTSTHAFNIPDNRKYAMYSWANKWIEGGFGRQVLGETWLSHHGEHGSESTRGVIAQGQEAHPIVRGIQPGEIWGPTDVYGVRLPLPGDSTPVVLGQVLAGMKSDDAPVEGEKNNPMMPIAWTKSYKGRSGKTSRTFTTTIGAATDFVSVGVRRMIVNAVYWGLGMEDRIDPASCVDLVGDFQPTPFSFGGFKKGTFPRDYALPTVAPEAVKAAPGDNTPPEGFTALFNGKDLTNWKGLVANPPERAKMTPAELAEKQKAADERMNAHWKVIDGILVFDGKGDNLCTQKDYGDFELYVDFKIEPKGDSGIYLRGSPQVQIWDPALFNLGSGGLFNNQKHPSKPTGNADKPVGEWNTFFIRMVGEKVTVKLNGETVVDDVVLENFWERDKPIYPTGSIELQNHGNTLYFKNIYVKELP